MLKRVQNCETSTTSMLLECDFFPPVYRLEDACITGEQSQHSYQLCKLKKQKASQKLNFLVFWCGDVQASQGQSSSALPHLDVVWLYFSIQFCPPQCDELTRGHDNSVKAKINGFRFVGWVSSQMNYRRLRIRERSAEFKHLDDIYHRDQHWYDNPSH